MKTRASFDMARFQHDIEVIRTERGVPLHRYLAEVDMQAVDRFETLQDGLNAVARMAAWAGLDLSEYVQVESEVVL